MMLSALFKADPKAARQLIVKNLEEFFHRVSAVKVIEKLDPANEKELWPLLSCVRADFTRDVIRVLGKIGTPKSIIPLEGAYERASGRDKSGLKHEVEAAIRSIRSRAEN